jgi:peptidoglycan/LPS O-acetylase OafA/YrhL
MAVAVVAVIINHFSKDILPSGYLGVDIFFVISGFVINILKAFLSIVMEAINNFVFARSTQQI